LLTLQIGLNQKIYKAIIAFSGTKINQVIEVYKIFF